MFKILSARYFPERRMYLNYIVEKDNTDTTIGLLTVTDEDDSFDVSIKVLTNLGALTSVSTDYHIKKNSPQDSVKFILDKVESTIKMVRMFF